MISFLRRNWLAILGGLILGVTSAYFDGMALGPMFCFGTVWYIIGGCVGVDVQEILEGKDS